MDATGQSPARRHGWERRHFALRRLHSLTGIVPLGLFLIEHLSTNFSVVLGKYQTYVRMLLSLPWLRLIEWLFIILPLAFHSLYGLFIASTGRSNVLNYRYLGNVRYTLQRATAVIALVFVVVHLFKFRFNYLLPGGREFTADNALSFAIAGLSNPHVALFYAIGVTAAVYHFANGLWTAAITWGVTRGGRSQWRWGWICLAVGAVLETLGIASLAWFYSH